MLLYAINPSQEYSGEEIFAALNEQTVTVPGTDGPALILPSLARSLAAVLFAMLRDGTFYEPQPSAAVT